MRLGLALYALLLLLASIGLRARTALSIDPARPRAVIESVWRRGRLVDRAVLRTAADSDPRIEAAAGEPGAELVLETIVADGPVLSHPELAFALSFVSGHDGASATLEGRTAYVTPDDLLARHAYDRGTRVLGVDLPVGADTAVLVALLAERLGVIPTRVLEEASIRRIRVARETPRRAEPTWAHVDGTTLGADVVAGAARDAARYLARNVDDGGHFRFLVDAVSGETRPGYDWPRHAGATFFLAQASARFREPELATACLRAAALVRDGALSACEGSTLEGAACVGTDPRVDVGSSALALLAFVEIARTRLDVSYADPAARLARFLRSQQRPDGEFMHEFDREARRPIDVQYPYYSGEAVFALGRAHRLDGGSDELAAASRGLSHLVGPSWTFFGDRYYFGEEHWTCQAMAELWDRAPDRDALDFCVRWQSYGRRLQYGSGDLVYDGDGAIGVGPLVTPRLTPVASRCEAGLATLEVVAQARPSEAPALARQQARALALLVRRQLRPGPVALFAEPDRVFGAMPGSEVDLLLRVDYAQHAGSAMLRWLDLEAR